MTSLTPDDAQDLSTSSMIPASAAQSAHFDVSKRSALSAPRRVKIVFDRAQFTQEHLNALHTCPQCSIAPPSPKVKERTYIYYPKLLLLLIPIGWPIVFIGYLLTRQTVKLRLPLCEDCNKRERHGRMIRSMAFLSVLFFPLVTSITMISLGVSGAMLAGTLASSVFAGIAASVIATKRTQDDVFEPKRITKSEVFVEVPETWPRILREQAPSITHQLR